MSIICSSDDDPTFSTTLFEDPDCKANADPKKDLKVDLKYDVCNNVDGMDTDFKLTKYVAPGPCT